jgi:hypothetical protein
MADTDFELTQSRRPRDAARRLSPGEKLAVVSQLRQTGRTVPSSPVREEPQRARWYIHVMLGQWLARGTRVLGSLSIS